MLATKAISLALVVLKNSRGRAKWASALFSQYSNNRLGFVPCHKEYGTLALAGPGLRIA